MFSEGFYSDIQLPFQISRPCTLRHHLVIITASPSRTRFSCTKTSVCAPDKCNIAIEREYENSTGTVVPNRNYLGRCLLHRQIDPQNPIQISANISWHRYCSLRGRVARPPLGDSPALIVNGCRFFLTMSQTQSYWCLILLSCFTSTTSCLSSCCYFKSTSDTSNEQDT